MRGRNRVQMLVLIRGRYCVSGLCHQAPMLRVYRSLTVHSMSTCRLLRCWCYPPMCRIKVAQSQASMKGRLQLDTERQDQKICHFNIS